MTGRAFLITRFAPSPTGDLHEGHAYAAIVAQEAARGSGGRFLLRIEDLDAGRARAEFEAGIFEDLAWLGIAPQGPVLRQSQRLDAYRSALSQIEELGLLYPCFCTRREIAREIAAMGGAPHADEAQIAPPYPGTCRRLSKERGAERIARGEPYVLRLDIRRAAALARAKGAMTFFEAWALGTPQWLAATPEDAGDIVLARKDVLASYHLAVVVDDAEQGVSLVTRGADLLAATHVQVLLQRLLGLATPLYGHHGLVRDDRGRRLAKRDKARSLKALRAAGWSADKLRAALPPLPDFTRLDANRLRPACPGDP